MITVCPHCAADLQGEPIPEASRKFFPEDETHFSRLWSIYGDHDRTSHFECPDCHGRIERGEAFK